MIKINKKNINTLNCLYNELLGEFLVDSTITDLEKKYDFFRDFEDIIKTDDVYGSDGYILVPDNCDAYKLAEIVTLVSILYNIVSKDSKIPYSTEDIYSILTGNIDELDIEAHIYSETIEEMKIKVEEFNHMLNLIEPIIEEFKQIKK